MEDCIDVHYVTAKLAVQVAESKRREKDGQLVSEVRRHDLAKFFEHEHAVRHAKEEVGFGWVDVDVDTRVEKMIAQHPAHRHG